MALKMLTLITEGEYLEHGGIMHCNDGYVDSCWFANNSFACNDRNTICNGIIEPLSIEPTMEPTIEPTPTTFPNDGIIDPTLEPTMNPSQEPTKTMANQQLVSSTVFPSSIEMKRENEASTNPDFLPIIASISTASAVIIVCIIIILRAYRKRDRVRSLEKRVSTLVEMEQTGEYNMTQSKTPTSENRGLHDLNPSPSTDLGHMFEDTEPQPGTPNLTAADQGPHDLLRNETIGSDVRDMYGYHDYPTPGTPNGTDDVMKVLVKGRESVVDDASNVPDNHDVVDTISNVRNEDFQSWEHLQILKWVLSLENGVFMEYREIIENNVRDQNLRGSDLFHVEMEDINDWGINQFAHVKLLYEHIKALTNVEGNVKESGDV